MPQTEVPHLTAERTTAVIATVTTVDSVGSRHIENYLLGSAPVRTKIYANVIFHINSVRKGEPDSQELRLNRILPNSQSDWPRLGDKFLVAFDGSAHRPRNVLLAPLQATSSRERP